MSNDDQSEEDLEDLYQNAPCGYLSLRGNGQIVKVNRTFCEWIGYSAEELLGTRFQALLNIAGRIYFETHFAPLVRLQGFFSEVALDLVRKDQQPFLVLVNAVERRGAGGKPVAVRLTVFNATDRRRYEGELLKARDDLKALAATLEQRVAEAAVRHERSETELTSQREEGELREQFIAVLGHDLRNPLASISAGTKLLQRQKLDASGDKIVIMMQQSVVRMAALIDNVLDFARGRLGAGITLARVEQPLEPTLRQVIDELQSAHPETPIRTQFKLGKPFEVDAARIGQLFSNLLGNALVYGTPGRPVVVTANTGSDFILSVSNSGEAIPQAAMERLFMPFSRGAVRPSKQGLGLGLYIASEIARAHGGTIDVSSTNGQTCFTLTIPRSTTSEGNATS